MRLPDTLVGYNFGDMCILLCGHSIMLDYQVALLHSTTSLELRTRRILISLNLKLLNNQFLLFIRFVLSLPLESELLGYAVVLVLADSSLLEGVCIVVWRVSDVGSGGVEGVFSGVMSWRLLALQSRINA